MDDATFEAKKQMTREVAARQSAKKKNKQFSELLGWVQDNLVWAVVALTLELRHQATITATTYHARKRAAEFYGLQDWVCENVVWAAIALRAKQVLAERRKAHWREVSLRSWHRGKERYAKRNAEWRKKNKAKLSKYNAKYMRERRKKDPLFNTLIRLRSDARYHLSRKNSKEATRYLLAQLPANEEFSRKWHIDHVVPLSAARNEDELKILAEWPNLQLLTAKENQLKFDHHPTDAEWAAFGAKRLAAANAVGLDLTDAKVKAVDKLMLALRRPSE